MLIIFYALPLEYGGDLAGTPVMDPDSLII